MSKFLASVTAVIVLAGGVTSPAAGATPDTPRWLCGIFPFLCR